VSRWWHSLLQATLGLLAATALVDRSAQDLRAQPQHSSNAQAYQAFQSGRVNEAIAIWKKALEESDIQNKKARIDKDVTIAIYFNLLEAYFALRNTTEADAILQTMGRMDISNRDKKQREAYEQAYIDLKLRMAANGL
jgi:tetratricopeptide (TPR) repeat protein